MIGKGNEASEIQRLSASRVRPDWTNNRHTSITHYVAYSSQGNLLVLCGHQHESIAKAVECIQTANGSVKAFTDGQERPLTSKEMQEMIGALLQLYGHAKKLAREDPSISGVLIRRGFMEALQQELTRSRSCTQPLTVVFLDLDDFKSVNEALGKRGAQLVLKVMGWTMQHNLRDSDVVARLEEERFALLLPRTDADTARVMLAKVRHALKNVLKTYSWNVTFSVLVVTFQDPPELDKMIDITERHMGSAKSQGEDCVSYLTLN